MKHKPGRPKNKTEKKNFSIRLTDVEREYIESKYKTVQAFINYSIHKMILRDQEKKNAD